MYLIAPLNNVPVHIFIEWCVMVAIRPRGNHVFMEKYVMVGEPCFHKIISDGSIRTGGTMYS